MLQLALRIVGGRMWAAYLLIAAVILAVIASICGGLFIRGYQWRDHKAKVQELKQEVATARIQVSQLETEHHDNQIVVAKLAAQQRTDGDEFRDIRIEARALDEHQPPVQCPVSRDFVRLWDRALDLSGTTGRAVVGPSNPGDVNGDAASEVTRADLLDNHIENAERGRSNYTKCAALIEWHRTHDRKAAK